MAKTWYTNELTVTYRYCVRHSGYAKISRACDKARRVGLIPDTKHIPETKEYIMHCTGTKPKLLELAKAILNMNEGNVEVTITKHHEAEQENPTP